MWDLPAGFASCLCVKITIHSHSTLCPLSLLLQMENNALAGRQNSPTGIVSMWSVGGGRGRVWQHSLPFTVEDSVCFEPHLEVDREEEPKTVPIQETKHTRTSL